MYLRDNNFYKFNNRKDFLDFVLDTRSLFPCNEEWEEFFGITLPIDEDGEYTEDLYEYASHTSKFDEEPTSYPAIAYCVIETNRTRFGVDNIRVFDWITDDSFEEEKESEKTNKTAQWTNSVFGTEVGEDFKKAIYDYASKCVKARKGYPEIYTVLHKSVDILLYEFEVETEL